MKKLIYLLLFYPLLTNGQSNDVATTFATVGDYEDWKIFFDGCEYENRKTCEYKGEYIGVYWAEHDLVCTPPFGLLTLPTSMDVDIRKHDKKDFKGFEKLITRDLPKFFSQYSYSYDYTHQFALFIQEIDFEFVYGDSGRTIAQAHSPLQGDVRIIINIDKWENLNNYERVWLMAHEFGHEAFGMEHGDNILMYPVIPSKDLNNLSKENFGGLSKMLFLGDSSQVTFAFNILFEALLDYFTDIAGNPNKYINIPKKRNFFIEETNEEIERTIFFFGAQNFDGKFYDPEGLLKSTN